MKDVRIKEGKRKKGGLNEMPKVPRPNPPKPMCTKRGKGCFGVVILKFILLENGG